MTECSACVKLKIQSLIQSIGKKKKWVEGEDRIAKIVHNVKQDLVGHV